MRNSRPLPGERRLGARGRLGARDPDEDVYFAAPERRTGGALRAIRKIVLGVLLLIGSVVLVVSGVLGVLLYRHAHPPRLTSEETPESLFTRYEDASFTSSDGVSMSGWWIPGREKAPALILCHDRGASRASLLGLAARLSAESYSVLLFDARGHGKSGGTSSFGVLEKRDVIGAIDWVGSNTKADATQIGVFGVGMGAYAADPGCARASPGAVPRPRLSVRRCGDPVRHLQSSFRVPPKRAHGMVAPSLRPRLPRPFRQGDGRSARA